MAVSVVLAHSLVGYTLLKLLCNKSFDPQCIHYAQIWMFACQILVILCSHLFSYICVSRRRALFGLNRANYKAMARL